ncbi:MAG: hypothetical protein Q8R83_00095 [Legionellaceae bacterium]|nr:hypothetical protein [Legionellaceae bacterium]
MKRIFVLLFILGLGNAFAITPPTPPPLPPSNVITIGLDPSNFYCVTSPQTAQVSFTNNSSTNIKLDRGFLYLSATYSDINGNILGTDVPLVSEFVPVLGLTLPAGSTSQPQSVSYTARFPQLCCLASQAKVTVRYFLLVSATPIPYTQTIFTVGIDHSSGC